MQTRMKPLWLPACFLLLVACTNASAERDSERQASRPAEGDVTIEFDIVNAAGDATRHFKGGETARFVFNVRNDGSQSRQLAHTFPPHRVQVLSAQDAELVWQAWEGQMFPQVMRDKGLPPHDSVVFSIDWKIDANIAAGNYRVQPSFHGFIGSQALPQELASVEITVQ